LEKFLDITFTSSPKAEDIDLIYNGLHAFNQKELPRLEDNAFAIFVRDDSGCLVGGLTGSMFTSSAQIRFLWLAESLRHEGVGGQLIKRLVQQSKLNKIKQIAVDTYSFQAPRFYENNGFKEIARYKNYLDDGIDKIFYLKEL